MRVTASDIEPMEPTVLPLAHLTRRRGDGIADDGESTGDNGLRRPAHLRAVVVTAALVVAVGLVLGIVVFNASAPELGRGSATADAAATAYVHAVNAGDEKAAADVVCTSFADDARAAAASGRDGGIQFALGKVTKTGKTDAVATIRQTSTLPGGTTRTSAAGVSVLRSAGRRLVCGQLG